MIKPETQQWKGLSHIKEIADRRGGAIIWYVKKIMYLYGNFEPGSETLQTVVGIK